MRKSHYVVILKDADKIIAWETAYDAKWKKQNAKLFI